LSNQKGNKLLDFLAGKGFYVVLILCVAAIGVSGYMLFFGGPEDDIPGSPSLALVSPNPSPALPSAAPPVPSPSPVLPPPSPPRQLIPSPPPLPQSGAPDPAEDAGVPDPAEDSVETAGSAEDIPDVPDVPDVPADEPVTETVFALPVSGNLLVPYSESADVFYEYLREWRYHPGVDLEANAGALVLCAADGVVKEVIESAARNMGTTVVVEHANGFETLYSNLSETVSVRAGQTIAAGDTVGTVGSTAISELALPPHLHFEILKNGEPVDPMEYLPE
jgi:murein DD-endopeptidase MepM/ murein hydrolase activator NlpD